MTRRWLGLFVPAAFGLSVVLTARASSIAPLVYDDLIAVQLALQSVPLQQRDKLIVKQYIRESGICDWGCGPLKVWVTVNGKRIDLPVENGNVTGMLDPGLAGKNLAIHSNSPLPLRLGTDVGILPPPKADVPATYFLESFRQVNSLIAGVWQRKRGFIWALFAPEVGGLDVYYLHADTPIQIQEGASIAHLPAWAPGTDPVVIRRGFLRAHAGSLLHFPGPINEITIDAK
jgi:hypothetical protein